MCNSLVGGRLRWLVVMVGRGKAEEEEGSHSLSHPPFFALQDKGIEKMVNAETTFRREWH